jgi:hypothetical protein
MNCPAIVAALLAVFAMAACHSSGTTATGAEESFNSITGNLTTTAEAPLNDTYEAAQAAVTDLEYTIASKSKDATKALIEAHTADKSTIHIVLDKRSDHVTDVSVSVGSLGKESTARTVVDKMLSHLKK